MSFYSNLGIGWIKFFVLLDILNYSGFLFKSGGFMVLTQCFCPGGKTETNISATGL